MIGEAGFREAVRLERSVGRVVVSPVAPIAERVEGGPAVCMHWCLRKEKEIRGVLVYSCDYVDQGRATGPCFFSVDGEEPESCARPGGLWRTNSKCGLIRSRRGREIGKARGEGDPV